MTYFITKTLNSLKSYLLFLQELWNNLSPSIYPEKLRDTLGEKLVKAKLRLRFLH